MSFRSFITVLRMGAAGVVPLLLALGVSLSAHAADPLGSLTVEGADVRIPIPDRGMVFKVGNTAKLFELRDDRLVIAIPQPDAPDALCAVPWSAQNAPAWVSNERMVTFGRIAATADGTLRLVAGEKLPVMAMGQEDYRVLVTRFGRTAEVDIPRSTGGLTFGLADEKPIASPTENAAQVTASPKPAPGPAKPRITIEGSGDIVMIRTNEPVVAVTPVVVQPPPVVQPEPVTATNTPVATVEAPANEPPATRAKKSTGFQLPLVLRDTESLIVIFVFVALIVILLLIQRKMIQRKGEAEATPAPVAAAKPVAPAMSGSALQMKKEKREQNVAENFPKAAPMKFVSSKKNQTVILGQQNLLGGPPRPGAGTPMSASDTALIPSPSVLPDHRQGGVLWIGKYQVEQLLGRGRMGVVYKAFQQDLNRSVALKLLAEGGHASEKSRERFIKEAQSIAKLHHPNIISVYEVGEWEGQPYFTMDFVDGKSLDKMIVKQKLPTAEAARLARDIALAMEYAHVNGIIHRDLKPGNIIINTKGDPVITDFGLARQLDQASMHAGDDILGTPAYMSPEQARGRSAETDARSDVYSVGAILFAMLTGDDPFGGNSLLDTLHKVIHDKPTAPDKTHPEIDPAISAICMKALAKDPKKRQQTAGELAADLNKYIAVITSGTTAAASAPRPGLFARIFSRG